MQNKVLQGLGHENGQKENLLNKQSVQCTNKIIQHKVIGQVLKQRLAKHSGSLNEFRLRFFAKQASPAFPGLDFPRRNLVRCSSQALPTGHQWLGWIIFRHLRTPSNNTEEGACTFYFVSQSYSVRFLLAHGLQEYTSSSGAGNYHKS